MSSDLSKITVLMPLVTDNAGSTLLQYQLEVDDGLQGPLSAYYTGLNRTVDVATTIGRTYRFRYRISNILGWSGFSDLTYILSGYVPTKPLEMPSLVSVDQSQITLLFSPCAESNGDLAFQYLVYM